MKHYGWLVSPYTAKTRAYLQFKGAEFEDIAPTAWQLYGPIRGAVGRMVMPTIRLDDGTWLQDSTVIIDTLEQRLDGASVVPSEPSVALAHRLLELHADEWLPMVMMHSRWNIPANVEFAKSEFARTGIPWLPLPISRLATASIARRMAGYLPLLGVTSRTRAGIEAFGRTLIARLDDHLAEHPFLLGSRPGVGDFALYGPLWAHCFRDPGSTHWFDAAAHVRSWFERLQQPRAEDGAFLDHVPTSLDAIFATLFEEQWPYLDALFEAIDRYCEEHPDAKRVPRALGNTPFAVGGAEGNRRLLTFAAWKAQRAIELYEGASDPWLERVGGLRALRREVRNPQELVGFRMRLRPERPESG